MTILVKTKNASYIVDRENNCWTRTSESHPRPDDGLWVVGGFTIGDIGERCFAHFTHHPEGALGRWTSSVLTIEDAG